MVRAPRSAAGRGPARSTSSLLGTSRLRAVINAVGAAGRAARRRCSLVVARRARPARSSLLAVATDRAEGRSSSRRSCCARCATPRSGARSSRSSASSTSLLLGALGTGAGAASSRARCRSPTSTPDSLLVPASLATVLTGFLMLTTRRKAIMQVLGYLRARERHLPLRPAAARGDAVPRRGRRAARPVHRRLRDGHHHPPHQPRVRLASSTEHLTALKE